MKQIIAKVKRNLSGFLSKALALSLLSLGLAGCIQDEVIFFGIDKVDNLRMTNIKFNDKTQDGLFYASYLDGDTVVDIRAPVKAEKLTEDGYQITLVGKGITFKLIRDGRLLYCKKYKCIGCDKVEVEDAFSGLPKIWGNK